jgi:lipopolysaccharide assembly outer membrane protein LptD (OstA)
MSKIRFLILTLAALLTLVSVPQFVEAQRLRIRIVSAGALMHSGNMADIVKVTGNPVFEHEGAYLYCDSAWLNEVENNMDCYGHVRIKSSDTLNLYGKFLHYDGNTKIATVKDDVKLVDKQTTLTTDFMVFDRNTGIANYTSGGKMVNGDNILTSRRCFTIPVKN